MSAGEIFDDLHDTVFDVLAVDATWTPPNGSPAPVRLVYHESTSVISELGDVLDPRPSVELPRPVFGSKPRGTVDIPTVGIFNLDRPVDGGDEYVTRMYVQPVPA